MNKTDHAIRELETNLRKMEERLKELVSLKMPSNSLVAQMHFHALVMCRLSIESVKQTLTHLQSVRRFEKIHPSLAAK